MGPWRAGRGGARYVNQGSEGVDRFCGGYACGRRGWGWYGGEESNLKEVCVAETFITRAARVTQKRYEWNGLPWWMMVPDGALKAGQKVSSHGDPSSGLAHERQTRRWMAGRRSLVQISKAIEQGVLRPEPSGQPLAYLAPQKS